MKASLEVGIVVLLLVFCLTLAHVSNDFRGMGGNQNLTRGLISKKGVSKHCPVCFRLPPCTTTARHDQPNVHGGS